MIGKKSTSKKTAIIITGNPKFIIGNERASAFYDELKEHLERNGYDVSFHAGEPHTSPPKANLWVGHSRGADRLRFAPKGTRTVALGVFGGVSHPMDNTAMEKFDSQRHGNIIPNKFHYILTNEMKDALLPQAPAIIAHCNMNYLKILEASNNFYSLATKKSLEFPIVNIFTEDKVQLYGLYIKPQTSNSIFINIHGTASNFYEEDFIKYLTEDFMENNISMLSTNNRGTGVYDCYAKTGSAVEKFEDCIKDIDAWIEFAIKQKYKKIILSGHSLGTEKVVYYMSNGKYKNKVNGIILLAPADSYASHRQLNGKPNRTI